MGCDLSPLQVLAELPELPYVPFGQDSPSMSAALRDVGEQRHARQFFFNFMFLFWWCGYVVLSHLRTAPEQGCDQVRHCGGPKKDPS